MDLSISVVGSEWRRLIMVVSISASCFIPGSNGIAQTDRNLGMSGRSLASVVGDRKLLGTVDRKPVGRIVGWLEEVLLIEAKVRLNAVIHTGVIISAINAPKFEGFTRNGSIWVRFSVRKAGGEDVIIEQPVVGFYRLQTDGAPDKKRPIVQMKICIAGHVKNADFILWDKAPKGYSIVLGRSFLAKKVLVDPSRKFLGRGAC